MPKQRPLVIKRPDFDSNIYQLIAAREVAAIQAECNAATAKCHAKAERKALKKAREIIDRFLPSES